MYGWIEKVDFEKISPDFRCDFEGFLPIKTLVESKCAEIPEKPGVYLIVTKDTQMPGFNADNPTFTAGKHQPKPDKVLEGQWVPASPVVYIGKAGGKKYKSNLKTRLTQYFTWFDRKGYGHSGGRDIWQINNPGELLVAWLVTEEEPRECERKLLERFDDTFGKKEQKKGNKQKKCRPFANHQS